MVRASERSDAKPAPGRRQASRPEDARLRRWLAALEGSAHEGVGETAQPHIPRADDRQRCARYLEGLEARPFHDRRAFPWAARLEREWRVIRDELSTVWSEGGFVAHSVTHALARKGAWCAFTLWDHGVRVDENCARCPRTTRLVEAIAGATSAGLVYFSALAPHTHIRAHAGPTNARIRCHLPLVVPRGCSLTVGGTTRRWQPGRCLVFDDSFLHEAVNPSDRWRFALIVDVWHPALTAHERTVLGRVLATALGRQGRRNARPAGKTPLGAARAFAVSSG